MPTMKYSISTIAVVLLMATGAMFLGRADRESPESIAGTEEQVDTGSVTTEEEPAAALKPEPSSSEFISAEDERRDLRSANQCAHNQAKEGAELVTVASTVTVGESRRYRYEVANHFESPLTTVKFGEDSHFYFLNMPGRFPESIVAPPGWVGESVALHESEYFRIFWVAEGGMNQGMSEAGFELTFPVNFPDQEEKYANLYSSDGNPVEKLDMGTPPFTAVFKDGSCYWGLAKSL